MFGLFLETNKLQNLMGLVPYLLVCIDLLYTYFILFPSLPIIAVENTDRLVNGTSPGKTVLIRKKKDYDMRN